MGGGTLRLAPARTAPTQVSTAAAGGASMAAAAATPLRDGARSAPADTSTTVGDTTRAFARQRTRTPSVATASRPLTSAIAARREKRPPSRGRARGRERSCPPCCLLRIRRVLRCRRRRPQLPPPTAGATRTNRCHRTRFDGGGPSPRSDSPLWRRRREDQRPTWRHQPKGAARPCSQHRTAVGGYRGGAGRHPKQTASVAGVDDVPAALALVRTPFRGIDSATSAGDASSAAADGRACAGVVVS